MSRAREKVALASRSTRAPLRPHTWFQVNGQTKSFAALRYLIFRWACFLVYDINAGRVQMCNHRRKLFNEFYYLKHFFYQEYQTNISRFVTTHYLIFFYEYRYPAFSYARVFHFIREYYYFVRIVR